MLGLPFLNINIFEMWMWFFVALLKVPWVKMSTSDRDFEMNLCYTPKAFSCLEETKYNINHCLELAPSFPKMYNITMF